MLEDAHSKPALDATLIPSADDTTHEPHDPPNAERKVSLLHGGVGSRCGRRFDWGTLSHLFLPGGL